MSLHSASLSSQMRWRFDGALGIAILAGFGAMPAAAQDFNGDGFSDLAIGAPFEDIGNETECGAVFVIYGKGTGLAAAGAQGAVIRGQMFTQDTGGIHGVPNTQEYFGRALAWGDFNDDGYDDLAIGIPYESEDIEPDTWGYGAVEILYGGAMGLDPDNTPAAQFWHQDSPGVMDECEGSDYFGSTVAAGDFNGDGKADLAIGIPSEDHGEATLNVGEVDVLYGNAAGLGAGGGAQIWNEDSALIGTGVEANAQFGFGIAAGDFDGDGDHDIAISAPGREVNGGTQVGAVYSLLSGAAAGVGGEGWAAAEWHFDVMGIPGAAGANEHFGDALESGDFNGDARDDLAIGTPDDNVGAVDWAGTVVVIYGSDDSLIARAIDGAVIPAQMWHQDRPGIQGVTDTLDNFGWPLAAADFNGDGVYDLAIGVEHDATGLANGGSVNVIYGSPNPGGLQARLTAGAVIAAQIWHQDRPGVPDQTDPLDGFGLGMAGR